LLFRVESTHRFKQSGGPGDSTPAAIRQQPRALVPQEPASRARGFYGARRAASTSSAFISSDKDLPTRNNSFAAAFTQS